MRKWEFILQSGSCKMGVIKWEYENGSQMFEKMGVYFTKWELKLRVIK